jgi:hypothetical protein
MEVSAKGGQAKPVIHNATGKLVNIYLTYW